MLSEAPIRLLQEEPYFVAKVPVPDSYLFFCPEQSRQGTLIASLFCYGSGKLSVWNSPQKRFIRVYSDILPPDLARHSLTPDGCSLVSIVRGPDGSSKSLCFWRPSSNKRDVVSTVISCSSVAKRGIEEVIALSPLAAVIQVPPDLSSKTGLTIYLVTHENGDNVRFQPLIRFPFGAEVQARGMAASWIQSCDASEYRVPVEDLQFKSPTTQGRRPSLRDRMAIAESAASTATSVVVALLVQDNLLSYEQRSVLFLANPLTVSRIPLNAPSPHDQAFVSFADTGISTPLMGSTQQRVATHGFHPAAVVAYDNIIFSVDVITGLLRRLTSPNSTERVVAIATMESDILVVKRHPASVLTACAGPSIGPLSTAAPVATLGRLSFMPRVSMSRLPIRIRGSSTGLNYGLSPIVKCISRSGVPLVPEVCLPRCLVSLALIDDGVLSLYGLVYSRCSAPMASLPRPSTSEAILCPLLAGYESDFFLEQARCKQLESVPATNQSRSLAQIPIECAGDTQKPPSDHKTHSLLEALDMDSSTANSALMASCFRVFALPGTLRGLPLHALEEMKCPQSVFRALLVGCVYSIGCLTSLIASVPFTSFDQRACAALKTEPAAADTDIPFVPHSSLKLSLALLRSAFTQPIHWAESRMESLIRHLKVLQAVGLRLCDLAGPMPSTLPTTPTAAPIQPDSDDSQSSSSSDSPRSPVRRRSSVSPIVSTPKASPMPPVAENDAIQCLLWPERPFTAMLSTDPNLLITFSSQFIADLSNALSNFDTNSVRTLLGSGALWLPPVTHRNISSALCL